ncbi:MAG: TonB-dependent receptor [Bacteroidota bacterium]
MKLKITLLCLVFFLAHLSQTIAQSNVVTGKVLNKTTNEPLVGATVKVLGTKTAVVTDSSGNFSVNLTKGSVLVVSYVGMNSQQKSVRGAERLVFSLEENAESTLKDVVVNVGYGTQKKSVLTGAISSVKAKDIEKVPNGRIEQVLQGRVSGVTVMANSGQPGSASTIRVRGITTFGGGNDPLWVIDGTVLDAGAIGAINQSDIESIEVLKDATSAAIYGTRAATGVILVTTKKGKAGKLSVSYNGFYGVSAPEKQLNLLNATQYAALMNEKSVAGGGSVLFPNLGSLGTGTDWQKQIFNNSANRYSHELSLSGGTEKSTFYLSFGRQDQQGIVASEISNYTKTNIRLNSTHKISKVFTFGQSIGYSHQKAVGLGNTNSEYGGPLSSAINLDPITPVVVTDPVVAASGQYPVNAIKDGYGNPFGISSIVGQEMTNPKAYIQTRLGSFDWSDDVIGNAYLEIAVNKHIKVKSTIGGKLAYWGSQGFTPVAYLSATNNVTKNSFGKSTNTTLNWNIENTIMYSNKIKDHNFNVLLGQGAYVDNNGGGTYASISDLPISSYEDASFNFPTTAANSNSSTYDLTIHKVSSLFARVNYDYKEKYMFTGIYRRDGSTRFGANNKFGIFPSFSLGWVASKEDFWKKNDFVKYLKVRGGYGKVGNDNIVDFGYLSTVIGGFNYTLGNSGLITTGYAPKTLDNPDLHWEQTTQTNIGFDAQLLSNFSLTFDYFNKKTSGILRYIPIPGYVGVSSSPVGNIADMQNTGLEFELGYHKKFGELNFSFTGNFATLKNEVTYVNTDADFINGDAAFQSMGPVTRTQVGQSYNSFYGYQTAGIFQTVADVNNYKNTAGGLIQPNAKPGDFRWVDANGDGVIDPKDKVFLGSNIPKFTYGFTMNFEYKGFDLMVFAQGAGGNKIFQGLRRLDIGTANYQTKAMSRWTGAGTSNDFPRLTTDDQNGNFTNMSNFYLEDGDYLRLKVVQFGYTFHHKLLNKIGASKFRMYVTAENLLTLTNYTGYDPEIGGGVMGVDKGIYPQARSFIIGAQLQF